MGAFLSLAVPMTIIGTGIALFIIWVTKPRYTENNKSYNNQSQTNPAILIIGSVIALSCAYLAYSSYRDRAEAEQIAKELEEAAKKIEQDTEKALKKAQRRAQREEEARRNRFTPSKLEHEISIPNRCGISGVVKVEATITRYGRPESVKLARTSGYECLDREALKAVGSAQFIPAKLGYDTVPELNYIDITFTN